MTQLATLEIEEGETTIAKLAGELDVSNTAQLGERIIDSVTNRSKAVLLDLREITYLDSSAVQLIFDLSDKLGSRRQRLHLLYEKGSFVAEVLRAVAVMEVAEAHTELAEALRAAEAGKPPSSQH